MALRSLSEPKKSLDLNVKLLKISGLWPGENAGWISFFGYYFPRITLISAHTMIILKFLDCVLIDSSFDRIIEHIYMSIIALMAILKNASLLYGAHDVEKLIMKIRNLNKSELSTDKNQIAIHNHHQQHAQKLTKMYLMSYFLIAFTVSVAPLTKKGGDRVLPHSMYYPYNHTVTPYYELTYAWVTITAVSDGFFIGLCDTLFLSLLISVIGHYKVLQYKMANIRENAIKKVTAMDDDFLVKISHVGMIKGEFQSANTRQVQKIGSTGQIIKLYHRNAQGNPKAAGKHSYQNRNMKEDAVCKEMENYVGNIVEHHKGIISAVRDIEAVFGIVLLYQFAPSLFFMCNIAFKVAKTPQFDTKFVSLLQLLLASIIQLFLYCWYSTTVTDESTKLNEALYRCDWLKSSIKFKKSIRLIFLRANKPVLLNAAGFVHVSLELFRNVLKSSYSFYTLLNQLDSPTSDKEH